MLAIDIVYDFVNSAGETAEEALTEEEFEYYQEAVEIAADIWDSVLRVKEDENPIGTGEPPQDYEVRIGVLPESDGAAGGGAPGAKNSDGLYFRGRMSVNEDVIRNWDKSKMLYVAIHEMGHAFDLYDFYEGDADWSTWKLMDGILNGKFGYEVHDEEFDGIAETTIMEQRPIDSENSGGVVGNGFYRLRPSQHGHDASWDM